MYRASTERWIPPHVSVRRYVRYITHLVPCVPPRASVPSRWISVKQRGVGYEWATAIWGMGVCSSCRTSGLLWGMGVCPDRLGPVSLHNGNFTVRTVRRGVPRRRRWPLHVPPRRWPEIFELF